MKSLETLKENINRLYEEIDSAALKAGRKKGEVLLCAVTKTRSVEEINMAISAGITDIGENRVQEIVDKYPNVAPVNWHMVGHLQTNKVKYIIDKVSLIHSVDSFKLAEEIDKRAGQGGKAMDVLIQVNSAMEESKFGITADETGALIEEILEKCPNIKIKGLMCMAPYFDDSEDAAVYFAAVKGLYDKYSEEIRHDRLDFSILSMGMSHDFEVAIREGANVIRIGTAIFGERDYR